VLADYVTLDQGTGIVHTAPGHGADDFRTGQKYGLEAYAPQDDDGRFTEGLPEYKGKTVFEANPIVVDLLQKRGMLVGERKLSHSYPHCWRCHNPVIFRATEQWFVSMDQPFGDPDPRIRSVSGDAARTLKTRAMFEIQNVKWIPDWGMARMSNMLVERPDWCISRQRFWGVPLIVFYCEACGRQLKDFRALRHVLPFFEREGADAWYTHTAEELLPAGTKCSCGAGKWRKENDILDVWFESGSTHLAVLTEANGLHWPAQVYLEGPDQFRGWFQSSLLIGVGTRGAAPYEQVVTHGWTLDEKGAPMSKSLGNALYPNEIVEKWGADLLRIWVVSQDFTADMRNSPAMMTQLAEAYRKIRNTFRFALSNLFDFDPARNSVPDADLWEMDAWMLQRTMTLVRRCCGGRNPEDPLDPEIAGWFGDFEFHRVFHSLHDFCSVDLSAFYFDVLKDRLYTFAPNTLGRRSAQTAVYRIANALVRLIAPILVFTAEEVWKYVPGKSSEAVSVHIESFPKPEDLHTGMSRGKQADWECLTEIRRDVLSALETARVEKIISAALEAKVTLCPRTDLNLESKDTLLDLLDSHKPFLPSLFIVSQVDVQDNISSQRPESVMEVGQRVVVEVKRADGKKCERCWNYSTRVGESADYPTLCERCLAALAEIERDGGALAGSAKR
jgi:isoleucyl-tRNA synthetase